MESRGLFNHRITRRRVLSAGTMGGLALLTARVAAQTTIDFKVPGGPSTRPITSAFPQKGPMILQRMAPPWLETPFEVFDQGVFTPNGRHYVSWHWSDFPSEIDAGTFRLSVRGHVNRALSLSLDDILGLPQVELAAVSVCAGNSRIYMRPRVPGAQWGYGSMGNAIWTGVRLSDILDLAGVKAGAVQVRFAGLDQPLGDGPKFVRSLGIDHARDEEVMIAFGMNGEQLPLLNGFPLKLVVPGWCAAYWIKMLNDIEVLDRPDTNYWTAKAYRIPDTPHATVRPGEAGVKLVPITRLLPRSFITNIRTGDSVTAGSPALARGIAFGGDCGVARVDLSIDAGRSWQPVQLGKDEGKYSFRRWQTQFTLAGRGEHTLMVRCTNENGESQPGDPVWNPGGYMQHAIESTHVLAA
ncbi:MAG: molybdopterin-dependent oxidoreductase [Rhodomicrobium sp.]